ncbi:MAG: glycosyltransferase family 87 protein [Verrucomicrobiota bacterium]
MQLFPKKVEWGFRFTGVFSFLFFFVVVILNGWSGDARRWAVGGLKDGDLVQHYAAGVLWKKNQMNAIYQNYQLGQWVNDWRKDLNSKKKLNRFNYVYSPLIAWGAGKLTVAPFEWWLKGWFFISIACYGAALVFLFCSLQWKRPPLSLILVAAGFPSLYYTLIPSQNTTLTLLILSAAALFLTQKKNWLAGLVLSCAFYKPQFAPYWGLFLFLCGDWKTTLGLIAGSLGWLGLSLVICGVEANRLWIESLIFMMRGDQFVLQGLNQSWTGFFLSVFPEWPRSLSALCAHSVALMILAWLVFKIRALKKRGAWNESFTLWVAAFWYLLASAYVGHYEILLGLPWWLICIQRSQWTWPQVLLTAMFWLLSLFSISGLLTGVSFSSMFTTAFVIGTMIVFVRTPIALDFKSR